jgi:hypothetical protein
VLTFIPLSSIYETASSSLFVGESLKPIKGQPRILPEKIPKNSDDTLDDFPKNVLGEFQMAQKYHKFFSRRYISEKGSLYVSMQG